MEDLREKTHSSEQNNFFVSTALDFTQWHLEYLFPWAALMILDTQTLEITWTSFLKYFSLYTSVYTLWAFSGKTLIWILLLRLDHRQSVLKNEWYTLALVLSFLIWQDLTSPAPEVKMFWVSWMSWQQKYAKEHCWVLLIKFMWEATLSLTHKETFLKLANIRGLWSSLIMLEKEGKEK